MPETRLNKTREAYMDAKDAYGKCDTCGAPATSMARDILAHEPPGAEFTQFSPVPGGGLKRGCDAHPAKSAVKITDQPRPE